MNKGKEIMSVLIAFALSVQISFAINEEYETKRYFQPNGASFLGKHFVDEFGGYYVTTDGFTFAYNESDKNFYYLMMNSSGDLVRSKFKVGLDDPEINGISKGVLISPALRAKTTGLGEQRSVSGGLNKAGPNVATSAPSSVNLQIILVEFTDVKHQNPTDWPMDLGYGGSKASYPEYTGLQFTNLLFSLNTYNNTSPDGEPAYGSMADYFRDMSLSTFALNGVIKNQIVTGVPRWVVLPNTKRYYHLGGWYTFYSDVISEALSQQGIQFTLDATNKLCIIYAGNMYVICSDASGNTVGGGIHPRCIGDGYIINERFKYPSMPDNMDQLPANEQDQYRNREVNDASFSHCGVHCHEFGHILGLWDQYYYPYTYGLWGLMGNGGNKGGNSDNLRGNNPAPIVPKQRCDLGWLTFQNVDSKVLNAQLPYALNSVHKIKGSYSSEYILVENRQTGSGWNRFLPAGGLLVWRV